MALKVSDVARLAGRVLGSGLCTVSALGPKAAMDAPERFESRVFG